MAEWLEDVMRAAVRMRRAQKAYFADRTREKLVAAKEAEAALDRLLGRQQVDLFGYDLGRDPADG
ncbi:MAG: hypothetical protein ACK4KW_14170 [Gemmobacter sp.]